ncbi:MAG: choice-of-anchor L domain-containing protein [Kofleriaceae bacterium]|nr:choice-of-anchor L domain-containing protein [Kofleriaceae bacterium]
MSLRAVRFVFGSVVITLAGCGSESGSARECGGVMTDISLDPLNCGRCGNACAENYSCIAGKCLIGECKPGDVQDCYTGPEETAGVGPCIGGQRTCIEGGTWTQCQGEVTPTGEDGAACRDGIDNNCNGAVDEDEDRDGDGLTTCQGDCCDSTECSNPALVNRGSFDAPGNNFDDDCNGVADDTVLLCDQNIASNTTNALDFARALDICQMATETDGRWGVISGSLTLTDGMGTPDPEAHAVRPKFGNGLLPQGGVNLAIISTGGAAAKSDTNPGYHPFVSYTHVSTPSNTSAFPLDFYTANGNSLPNAPGCPDPTGELANDPVMLTLRIRVPTNAKSFRLSTNFYSAEFPEWTCSRFNDFFVVLLDSTYNGMPANPTDKNLAFYQPMGTMNKVPVGVNLGHGNTGLFTQCVNGETGCSGETGSISTCIATNQLTGTGFDDAAPGDCDSNSLNGGATGWLVTSGNVTPGEIITLRIAVWDTSDHSFDSLAVIDGFTWSVDVAQPGTVIFRENPNLGQLAPNAIVEQQLSH